LSNDSRSETEEPPFVQKLHYVVKARKLKLNMKKKKVAIYNKKQIERRFHFKRNSLNLKPMGAQATTLIRFKEYRSRRMKRSVYRLVLNGVSDKRRADRLQPLMPPLVKEAYNMMRMLEGKSKGTSDSSNMKFLSPRIGAIMPDKNEVKGSLSPSLLPFYKDDSEEQLLPIPKLLDAAGMTEKDRDDILETVMEIAGARQVIDDAMKMLSNTELLGMQGELKDVTEKMMRMFAKMERTFTIKQKADMKRRGYTFLEKHQLRSLHNQNELAKHRSELDFDIDEYGKQSHSEREEALWLRLAEIAANGTVSLP
uniref:RNA-dependent RNA polymerase n=1 Tax=Angiostrongylus cantonensis TaxID=6313 RepID=A0A0K0D2F9_ANGCA